VPNDNTGELTQKVDPSSSLVLLGQETLTSGLEEITGRGDQGRKGMKVKFIKSKVMFYNFGN